MARYECREFRGTRCPAAPDAVGQAVRRTPHPSVERVESAVRLHVHLLYDHLVLSYSTYSVLYESAYAFIERFVRPTTRGDETLKYDGRRDRTARVVTSLSRQH